MADIWAYTQRTTESGPCWMSVSSSKFPSVLSDLDYSELLMLLTERGWVQAQVNEKALVKTLGFLESLCKLVP